jgi:hypothetical protein
MPLWKGGPDTEENIQLLCANCHEDKSREDYRGFKHSDETKAKISAKKLGQTLTAEQVTKMRNALKGRKKSPEHLAKLRKPRSAEGRANIKRAIRAFFDGMSPEQRAEFLQNREATKRKNNQIRKTNVG